jgi:fumarate reductase iron-sulfur subunit
MKITIKRYCKHRSPSPSVDVKYKIEKKVTMLLEALSYIKREIDPSLSFSSGCRSEVCGSCGVRVNGKEVLACGYKVQDGDVIEPLNRVKVIKDLVVDANLILETIKRAKAFPKTATSVKVQSKEDEKLIEKQSDCILCESCFSACPVLEVDSEFLGPFALTRAFRYVNDSRNNDTLETIEAIQKKGVWDCTLCGECTLVCPQGIDPKSDILNLRMKSVQAGFEDPSFAQGGFGGDDFLGGGF